MLTRTRTFVVAAVVCGVVAALLVLLVLGQNNRTISRRVEEEKRRLGQQISALAATRYIEANQIIRQGDIEERDFFEVDLPQGVSLAQAPEEAIDRVAAVPIFAGEPICIEKLRAGFKPVSARVPPGSVAFAMPIQPEYAVGALVSPGDIIDIIEVASGAAFGEAPEPTRILFERVEVLGIAGEYPYGGTISTEEAVEAGGPAGFGSSGLGQGTDAVRDKILLLKLGREQAVELADAMENSRLYIALHPWGQ